MGTKYGPQKRTQEKRQSVAAAKDAAKDLAWTFDDSEPVEETTVPTEVTATTRITERTVRVARTGMLVEFAVTVSEFVAGKWGERLCIDTCNHGDIHRHRDGNHRDEPEHIAPIASPRDLQTGFFDAIDEAFNSVEDAESGQYGN